MEMFIVLAIAFILGAALAFFWSKFAYEKQLQKAKTSAEKERDVLLVDNLILEQRLILINKQREAANKVVNY